ncbi:Aspartic proteinase CDR1 [Melia azedarach]|uniref:Aspartic proteinase CDR1 n=1 Tax=Melia azedarach TaxID=155640 RepID=A0ACC1XMS2_MELAZ|nr:Aspartic proteinase CDR1 [Melia azedarach]
MANLSMIFSVMMLTFMISISMPNICSSRVVESSSSDVSSPLKGFSAPLIHRSSPESPFYDPKATHHDFMRDSLRTSSARSAYFNWIRTKNSSIKYPVSPVELFNMNYVMKYSIGTPPVETFAVPDTGSTIIWTQCLNCTRCYNQTIPIFDPSKSSTYEPVTCAADECKNAPSTMCKGKECWYQIEYEDESFSAGNIAKETLTFIDIFKRQHDAGKYPLSNMLIGCGHDNTDVPGVGVPGVVGLSSHRYSFVGQLGFDIFSYCVSSNVSAGHSQIRFGLPAIISGKLSTALSPNKEGFYYFKNVEGLYVDGEKVPDIPEWIFQYAEGGLGGLLLDSGTTFTELYGLALDNLIEKIRSTMRSDAKEEQDATNEWDLCYNMEHRSDVLPEIEFWFKDSNDSFPIADDNAWIDNNHGQFCLGIGRSSGTISVLGMYQQRDVNVGFDLKLNQVSFFYNVNCPQYVSLS